ncbi:hypothetical protein [uncultured Oscillibacter sp.]|uniref:hypothetical protein n=1 Tax=uncultured Oscillibacter sp. TaxID=876091 RepID=UPI0025D77D28|nr:hypothetical protein [uncultured Oscillibacter sp.]
MNKKMVCGVLLTVVGLIYSAFCFFYTLMNPCIYNGIGGLMGSFLGADTLLPFMISTAVMCIGLLLCFLEAYQKH